MMTRYCTLICIVLTAAVLTPTRVGAADPLNELAETTNKKLVKLFGAGGFSRLNNFGTGIIISKDGYVLTVASQLLDTSDLVVHLHDGQRMKAQVVVVEPELDAAIVKIRAEGKKLEDPIGMELDYFDIVEAAKRPPAVIGDWVLALSNTFRDRARGTAEPPAWRGDGTDETRRSPRCVRFLHRDVYVTDMIMNNPGRRAASTAKGLLGVIGRRSRTARATLDELCDPGDRESGHQDQ